MEDLEYIVDAIIDGIVSQYRILEVVGVVGEGGSDEVYTALKNQYWQWKDVKKAIKPPSPPAEMPDDERCMDCGKSEHDESIHVRYGPDQDNPRKHEFRSVLNCPKYPKAIAKKPANSCVGCTVTGCKAKGKYESRFEDDGDGALDD